MHQSHCLWSKLPASFRQSDPDHSSSHASHPNHHLMPSIIAVRYGHRPLLILFFTLNSKEKVTFSRNPTYHLFHLFHTPSGLPTRTPGLLYGFLLVFHGKNLELELPQYFARGRE